MKNIEIKGASIHNLKNIDISIPKNKLILITGVSGSGKSSLVFDIIFEEGRKQYLESLGVIIGISGEDKFESIKGISPSIAVQQSIIRQGNPRSTVGSRTKILSLLSILYAKEGRIICHSCGIPVNNDLICCECGNKEERLEANFFSFNHPNGMCLECSGRGAEYRINLEKLIPNSKITLKEVLNKVEITPGYRRILDKNFKDHLSSPFVEIPCEVKEDILYGHYSDSNFQKRSFCITKAFHRLHIKGIDLKGLYEITECPLCNGFRIGEEGRSVVLNNKHIGELGKMTLNELLDFSQELYNKSVLTQFGNNIIKEIINKIESLVKIRLGHLSLYREVPTLSGGEIQRLFLNFHLVGKMDSLIYILDEPTVGLHESEKTELLKSIKALKELGNTVLMVEHDKNAIEMADHIIDIGPKAGIHGGNIVYQGDLSGLLNSQESITGLYLSGKKSMSTRTKNQSKNSCCLVIKSAKTNNLKNINVSFPLKKIVGIAGVSGSGKSTLISDTLIPRLKEHFQTIKESKKELKSDKLNGIRHISGFAEVSQAPIGRTVSSNPATYIGIWDKIRKIFAKQQTAKHQKLTAGHFSFNSKGACPECGGSGQEKIWLGGNINIYNTCSECHGKRYSDVALSVKYKGKTIADILEMQVSEAITFFKDSKDILSTLLVLDRIGMGYIELGQASTTLSGGEAQRIKLAKEIGKQRKGNILYVLDEPTTGLSLYDTSKLINLLDELVLKGNSVIVIEHDIELLSTCDWIIEMGPGGGFDGGYVIAEGSPIEIKKNKESITGRYLEVE